MDFGWGAYDPDPIQLNMHAANYLDHGDDYRVNQEIHPSDPSLPNVFAVRRAVNAPPGPSANHPYIQADLWAYVSRDPEFMATWRT